MKLKLFKDGLERTTMPSKSKKQHNLMAAVAHNPAFAKKVGIKQSVCKEFVAADKGRKFAGGGEMKHEDIKMDKKIAKKAAARYGSSESGKKVAGAILKKLRMKEDEDFEITDEQVEELFEAFEYDQENQMSFSEMIAAYKEHGLSVIAEEPTEEQFNKEIKDQIAESREHAEQFQKVLEKAQKRFKALKGVEERHANAYKQVLEKL